MGARAEGEHEKIKTTVTVQPLGEGVTLFQNFCFSITSPGIFRNKILPCMPHIKDFYPQTRNPQNGCCQIKTNALK